MATLYILQNQHGYFLGKQGDWLDGRQANQLFRTNHRDEAINQQFEAGSKDYSLRIHSLEVEASAKGVPVIPEDKLPEPLLEAANETAIPETATAPESEANNS